MTINELSGTTTPAPSPPRRLMVTRRAKVRLIRNVHTRCVRAHRAHAPLGARRVTCAQRRQIWYLCLPDLHYITRDWKNVYFSLCGNQMWRCNADVAYFFFFLLDGEEFLWTIGWIVILRKLNEEFLFLFRRIWFWIFVNCWFFNFGYKDFVEFGFELL